MFDIGWTEMLVIAIVVIVVVGPKELPGMLRTFGKTTSKLRVMANDFRRQFDDAMKEADLDDLKKVADDVRALNPKNEIRKALSPMEKAAQDVRAGLDAAMKPVAKPDTGAEPVALEPKPAAPIKTGATAMPGETAAAKSSNGKAPASNGKAPAAAAAPGKAGPKPAAAKAKAAPAVKAAPSVKAKAASQAKASGTRLRAAKAKTDGAAS